MESKILSPTWGTQEFSRIKSESEESRREWILADYVLSRFPAEERKIMETAFRDAAEAAGVLIAEGPDAAMNRFNGPRNVE